jgi:EAL domain-containing protein (putative c-di-GMP-specific phosphodiesterase class I)
MGVLGALPADTFLAVNASPELLGERTLAEMLAATANRRIVLEVTEHVEVADYDALAGYLHQLRAAGCRIAVDDAGAGYASLRHILRLRPDYIKLDMTLTRDIDTDGDRRALASSLLTFAREVSATVIAEGIETQAELETLRGLGATLGQGYFLARPSEPAHLFPG